MLIITFKSSGVAFLICMLLVMLSERYKVNLDESSMLEKYILLALKILVYVISSLC